MLYVLNNCILVWLLLLPLIVSEEHVTVNAGQINLG